MPKTTSNSLPKSNEKDNRFRARLMAQLLVIFIALSLLGIRIGLVLKSSRVTSFQITRTLTTIPFLVAFCVLVLLKYILFKKARDWILKYANYFDLVFALVFTAEWLITLDGQLSKPKGETNYCYSLLGYMTFGSFSWRTLLQILISQLWQIRIIAPTVAWIFLTQFAVRHDQSDELFILLYGIFQMCYIILIFYYDYKMNFTFTIGSIQQQQWLQLNEFILNNVPENIAIMDLNGECQFINENFRKLMKRRTQADQVKQFLRSIKDIQKQRSENDSDSDESRIDLLHLERSNSSFARQNSRFETQEPTSLEELVTVFGTFIRKGFIKERSLYSFNGKFKEDEEDTQERSFQIHTSFIHYQPYKYILLILRDTTHRDMVLSLKGDMKYKDHLLASVSHELRTPLNGNINMIEAALRSKDISDNIKETLLLPAVKSSKFLLYLVNDILDLYQIKAQKLRLVFQQSNLKETLANILHLVELHAKKKGIELQTNIDPTIPDTFCTDHARLSQVILNLINNSIKFTQSGYVKLSAWPLIGTDIETDQINISIEDSGIGMSQADTCKLFKDFTHIDSKDRERLNPAGVGLGLKIANDLAKLLGPTGNPGIIVDSIVNKGSIFSFVIENKETGLETQLKAERQEENKEDPPSPLIPNEINFGTEASLQTKIARCNSLKSLPRLITEIPSQILFSICSCARVLVVDDDPFNIMAYEVILSSLGTKFESAYNGKSAIDKMLNKVRYPCCPNCHPYKVVFMDEEMPGMSGIATVEEIGRLQSQGLLPQMEIMGCTAHHDKEKIEEFLKAGITEYVSKPISFDTIKRILDKYDV